MTKSVLADIYAHLPGLDCGKCGSRKCTDFAKKLVFGTKRVYDCPHLNEENTEAILLIVEGYFK